MRDREPRHSPNSLFLLLAPALLGAMAADVIFRVSKPSAITKYFLRLERAKTSAKLFGRNLAVVPSSGAARFQVDDSREYVIKDRGSYAIVTHGRRASSFKTPGGMVFKVRGDDVVQVELRIPNETVAFPNGVEITFTEESR